MSELKAIYATDKDSVTGLYYPKSEADKVIAELKAENERLRGESCKLTDGCLRLKQCRKEKSEYRRRTPPLQPQAVPGDGEVVQRKVARS